ncbi:MAG TPA: AI-2E family transporter [Granulicella sp.]
MTEPVSSGSDPAQTRHDARASILFAIGCLLALALAWRLAKELEIIYVAGLFAVVLMPIVSWIMKLNLRGWHPPRAMAIVLLIAAVAAGLFLFFFFALPPVLHDLQAFSQDLPGKVPDLLARAKRIPLGGKIGLDAAAAHVQNGIAEAATYLVSSLPLWLSHLFDILTTIFLCLYFMLEGEHAYQFFLSLFRADQRQRLDATLQIAEVKMSKWLLGQGLLMLILGVSSTIVFGILQVRYFVLLGVLMGLFNLIPIAGAIVTVTLAACVAALDSWPKMFGVLIFYAIYINLENAYLTPRIMRSSVDLMGLTVLIALLIGTALAGIVGALVAVPTAALITVLLKEYAIHHDGEPV